MVLVMALVRALAMAKILEITRSLVVDLGMAPAIDQNYEFAASHCGGFLQSFS